MLFSKCRKEGKLEHTAFGRVLRPMRLDMASFRIGFPSVAVGEVRRSRWICTSTSMFRTLMQRLLVFFAAFTDPVDGHPKSPRASPPKSTRLGLELGLARLKRKSRSSSPTCVSQTEKTVSRTVTQNGIDLTSKQTGIDQTSKQVTWIDQTIE